MQVQACRVCAQHGDSDALLPAAARRLLPGGACSRLPLPHTWSVLAALAALGGLSRYSLDLKCHLTQTTMPYLLQRPRPQSTPTAARPPACFATVLPQHHNSRSLWLPTPTAFKTCSLGDGMSEDDLLGSTAREPLRTCCLKLASRLWAVCLQAGLEDARALQVGSGPRLCAQNGSA